MQIEIYADILFFVNFIMTFFVFYISNYLVKHKASLMRISLITFFSTTLYILMILFVPFTKTISAVSMPLIIFASVYFVYKPSLVNEFIKLVMIVFSVSFCVAGGSMAVFYYINIEAIIYNINSGEFSIKVLIVSSIVIYIFIKYGLHWYDKVLVKKQTFYEVRLFNNNFTLTLNALLDTGNTLREPITNKPVVVVEFISIKDILPNSLKVVFYEKQEDNLDKLLEVGASANIRLIPFKSVGQKNGLLIGIKIDKLEVIKENTIVHNDAIIAICNFELSSDKFYNALLSPQFLEC